MTNAVRIALHGFLGHPDDWSLFPDIHAIDLLKTPHLPFREWADEFNRSVEEDFPKRQKILMGYSLGGRLALHVVLQNPSLWAGVILISTHPGIASEEEIRERLSRDRTWAERFRNEEWEVVLSDWNAQAVFCGSALPQRNSPDPESWAERLEIWSLGNQEAHAEHLDRLNLPILWIAGERDIKFVKIARERQLFHPKSKVWIAPESGHRVLWDIPKQLSDEVNTFVKRIEDDDVSHRTMDLHQNLY